MIEWNPTSWLDASNDEDDGPDSFWIWKKVSPSEAAALSATLAGVYEDQFIVDNDQSESGSLAASLQSGSYDADPLRDDPGGDPLLEDPGGDPIYHEGP